MELTVKGWDFYLVHGFSVEGLHDKMWFQPGIDAPNSKPGYQVIIGYPKVLSGIPPEKKKIAYAMDLENSGEYLNLHHGLVYIDIDYGCV